MNEMTEEGTRFLLAREKQVNDVPGRLVAFAHFRFTIQGAKKVRHHTTESFFIKLSRDITHLRAIDTSKLPASIITLRLPTLLNTKCSTYHDEYSIFLLIFFLTT